jgi:hypothetical protein
MGSDEQIYLYSHYMQVMIEGWTRQPYLSPRDHEEGALHPILKI